MTCINVRNLTPPSFLNALSAATILCLLALTSPALSDPVHIRGIPGITDGDTLRVGKAKVRLFGIDAPERHQICETADGQTYACGTEATRHLADFIDGRTVDCTVVDVDRYQRSVAVCLVDGQDIGAWMVENGWAVAYRKYSLDYVDEEDKARISKVGMWGGKFEQPWDWRKAN